MLPVVTADQMRALDRRTIDDIGLPAMTLMETAGRAVAAAARRMLGGSRGHVRVVCGPGNNGGDGFVAARVLGAEGSDAVVYLAAPREAVRGDARAHLEILERSGGVIRMIATPEQLAAAGADATALVIDALFGVGLARPIDGHLAEVVAWMQRAGRILAVDLPSGLDTDTGRALGAAVVAERTVTMAARKIALVSAPGFAHAGEIEVADIGIPPAVVAAADVRTGLIEPGDVARWLPHSHALDHKGRRGHVLVVGGSPGMRGAGRLAAFAALRAGAGLSTLAADGELDAADPVMTRSLAPGAPLGAALAGKAAIVIGPGLGASDASVARVREVLACGVPAVLDADALNVLAADPSELARAAGPVVITPHPGEASRLLGISTAAIEADRLGAARSLAVATRAVVVLKGARTIVCDGAMRFDAIGDLRCAINPTGGPSLATGGSGDVLAGTIGALLAQGVPAFDAACAGAYVHGAAGDQLAAVHGPRGVVSSDLPAAIAAAIRAATS
ncbi:MAG TPA: NAD(P)H-hydrate dehydratase [Kofleriaceae bacterium]|nr:NAD(P)H-hydrate dehydratase [Kofleriaceae bacterium]